jgi:hypothetical protein
MNRYHPSDMAVGVAPSFGNVSASLFLDALNSGNVFVKMHKQWLRQRRRAGERPRTYSGRTYRRATIAFRQRLRQQVDQWIDSGRTPDGMEIPKDRRADVPQRYRHLGEPFDGTLLEPFMLLESEIQGNLRLGLHGGVEQVFAPYDNVHACQHFSSIPEREAARFFIWFFASDWRHRVVKCRKCGIYYLIKDPGRLYKRGTYCRSHSAAKSAEVITAQKRQDKHRELIRLASSAYKRLGSDQRGSDLRAFKQTIASRVNKATPPSTRMISPKSPIGIKWITRNFEEIKKHRM